jgi:hypothetical protein
MIIADDQLHDGDLAAWIHSSRQRRRIVTQLWSFTDAVLRSLGARTD